MNYLIASCLDKDTGILILSCYTDGDHDYPRKTTMSIETSPSPVTKWTPNFGIGQGLLLSLSSAMFMLAGTVVYDMVNLKPLEDGSFPALSGIHMVAIFGVFGLLAFWCSWGLVFRGIRDEVQLATIMTLASTAIVVSGIFAINSYTHDNWEKSVISWASDKYGIEAAKVTKYDYPGIVGKPATKSTPAVYIDPPKGIKYLTAENGKYLAELLPEQNNPEARQSFKPYDLSKEPKPLPEKK